MRATARPRCLRSTCRKRGGSWEISSSVSSRYSALRQRVWSRQKNFFEWGDLVMRPLPLREIADELALHESTVSRATSHKYMATPRGVVAFKRFFSRQSRTTNGGSCSDKEIRQLPREF